MKNSLSISITIAKCLITLQYFSNAQNSYIERFMENVLNAKVPNTQSIITTWILKGKNNLTVVDYPAVTRKTIDLDTDYSEMLICNSDIPVRWIPEVSY